MFGVRMYSFPSERMVSQRCWSVQIHSMFGRVSAAETACWDATPAAPARTKSRREIWELMAVRLSHQAGASEPRWNGRAAVLQ